MLTSAICRVAAASTEFRQEAHTVEICHPIAHVGLRVRDRGIVNRRPDLLHNEIE